MKIASLLLVAGLVVTSGCNVSFNVGGLSGVKGSGVPATEDRTLDGEFTAIELDGTGSLIVSQGEQSLSVTADDNLLDLISTEVVDGTLVIKNIESISPSSKIEFNLSTPELSKVSIDGAGNCELKSFQAEKLTLSVDGAGNFKGTGTVDELDISIDGAGSAKLQELESKNATVEIDGAGSAKVFASESVNSSIDGVGSIKVYGNPPEKKKDVDGIGSVSYVD